MSTSAYVKLLDMQNKYVELLPVTAVFDHPKNTEGVEGYYSDVIIHVDGRWVTIFSLHDDFIGIVDGLSLLECLWGHSDKVQSENRKENIATFQWSYPVELFLILPIEE